MTNKQKFTCEFAIKSSLHVLYDFLVTPNGLAEWFAEKVDQLENEFVFTWGNSSEKAILIHAEQEKSVKFRWDAMAKDEYFEFAIERNDITGISLLVITDFAEKNDIKDQIALWDAQVHELKHRLGC
jgi:uncharacterized protein YndB with AHSA1/START domain